jgi:hypothetical protein
VQDILVLALHLKDRPYESCRLVRAKLTQVPGGEEDNLIPAGIVQQWFEHMLPLALPLVGQAESGEIFLESQMEKAVDTTAIVIEATLQKNATKLADIAAELRRMGMRVTLTYARVVLL